MHFFEAVKRDIDFKFEYYKLEKIIINETQRTEYSYNSSINSWIEKRFRSWKRRDTFLSFNELRAHFGFITVDRHGIPEEESMPSTISMEKYFLYCEIIVNLAYDLNGVNNIYLSDTFNAIINTIRLNIERLGFEFKKANEGTIIVEKNAAAIEATDLLPDIADAIVEYNHFLLRGNIDRKKEILKLIADALEPERTSLEKACLQETKDFFFMVNNMNIRHNNCDPKDPKNYCKEFAILSNTEKEAWYDKIYEQALALIIIRNQKSEEKNLGNRGF